MANPTTNYGFVLPTATDLVTDLPADFDVALQGVDTRLKALQPGTTLGDLAYSSATANTNTRLGVGTNGQVLAVSGGVPAWTTPASGGGLTLLATATPAAASVVTFSSIVSGYKNLKLVWRGMYVDSTSTAGAWSLRLNNDSGTNYTVGSTGFGGNAYTENATEVGGTTSSGAFIGSPTTNSTQYDYQGFGSCDIYDYTNSGAHYLEWTSQSTTPGVRNYFATGEAVFKSTGAITRLDIVRLGSNNITGTVYLYGVN